MAIKASIVIMLLRIIVDIPQRVTLYVTLTVVELYSTAFFLLFILQCQPSSYFWSRFGGGQGSCIDNTITVGAVYAYSAISCVGDWICDRGPSSASSRGSPSAHAWTWASCTVHHRTETTSPTNREAHNKK